ncbi:Ubiquitin thioesterase OTU1 [Tritrichomonas foetus]|uniref:Ubiquitin thioesterase OTU n=1 Tax=Tritrichomonas foetus TaxID=1144522 RepID=A0A1J4KX22_9EUKA|nr:Ubiquitin thioesterase OTU1 [Tritrichomonas foetus]|eukprot:OHT14252.1 Ubiquitin thioesterase OTU1 [Tritrichomonas foetus]
MCACTLKLRYENQTHDLFSTQQSTVEELMEEIRDRTGVMPSRQQIMYNFPSKPLPNDSSSLKMTLQQLGVSRRELFTLILREHAQMTQQQSTSRLSEAIKVPIPSDNSCLFNSIAYLCMGSSNRGPELRNICINEIKNNPSIYTQAMLGATPENYCSWISQPTHWGGYIEMNILSKYFQVEICVLYIEEEKIVPINSCNATQRIFILYDNIHYDSVVFNGFGITEKKIVESSDVMAEQCALEMVKVLKAAGGYTNTKTATLKCDYCGKLFKGGKEAEAHGNATGHVSFSQVNI